MDPLSPLGFSRLFYAQKAFPAGAPPGPCWGGFKTLPQIPSWWGGSANPIPALSLWTRLSALLASRAQTHTPLRPLSAYLPSDAILELKNA